MTVALYFDGWLVPENSTTVWPDASGHLPGRLEIELTPPPGIKSERISIETPWGAYRAKLVSGSTRTISIDLHGNRRAKFVVNSDGVGQLGDGRFAIAKARFRLVEVAH
jgi:hypothetical protein